MEDSLYICEFLVSALERGVWPKDSRCPRKRYFYSAVSQPQRVILHDKMLEWACLILSQVSSCFMPWALPSVNYYSLVPLVPCMFTGPLILACSLSDLFACCDPSLVLVLAPACFIILWAIVHHCVNERSLSDIWIWVLYQVSLLPCQHQHGQYYQFDRDTKPNMAPSSMFQQLIRCEPVVLFCIFWCKITSCLFLNQICFCFVWSSRYTASFH